MHRSHEIGLWNSKPHLISDERRNLYFHRQTISSHSIYYIIHTMIPLQRLNLHCIFITENTVFIVINLNKNNYKDNAILYKR